MSDSIAESRLLVSTKLDRLSMKPQRVVLHTKLNIVPFCAESHLVSFSYFTDKNQHEALP